MNNKKLNIGVTDIILLVLSAVFFLGLLTFLAPCGPKDDGSWMTCHWAGQALRGISAVLLVISGIHFFVKDSKIKLGLSLAAIPAAILSLILPGNLIGLCMMNTMRCHSVMRTGTMIISVLILVQQIIIIN
mgnify:FL=1